MSPRILGEYIEASDEDIEITSDGHVFDEDLNCICREFEGFYLEWRWRFTGRWHIFRTKTKKGYRQELHRVKRAQYGEACGVNWKDHQENPKPCEGEYAIGRSNSGPSDLPVVIKCNSLRASKWSKLRAAAVLPRDAKRQSAWNGGRRLPPLVDP
jgi:hypothetical protein